MPAPAAWWLRSERLWWSAAPLGSTARPRQEVLSRHGAQQIAARVGWLSSARLSRLSSVAHHTNQHGPAGAAPTALIERQQATLCVCGNRSLVSAVIPTRREHAAATPRQRDFASSCNPPAEGTLGHPGHIRSRPISRPRTTSRPVTAHCRRLQTTQSR